jgi:hypothetical protein
MMMVVMMMMMMMIFEIFTAVIMKYAVFWNVTPCGSYKSHTA